MVLNYQGSNHLLRMVMAPKYLPEEVIIHPNHHLTKVIGSLGNPFWTFFASQKKIHTPKFNLPRTLRMRAQEDWHRGEERLGFCWIRGVFPFYTWKPKVWRFGNSWRWFSLFKGVIFWNSHVSFRGCIQRELKLWDPEVEEQSIVEYIFKC